MEARSKASPKVKTVTTNITHQRKKGIHLFMKNALEIVQSESES